MEWIAYIVFLSIGGVSGFLLGMKLQNGRAAEGLPTGTGESPSADGQARESAAADVQERILHLAEGLNERYERISHPRYLEKDPPFREAVTQLAQSDLTTRDLLGYYAGDNSVMACLATAALGERESVSEEDIIDDLLSSINYPANYTRYFALMTLHRKAEADLLPRVICKLDDDWTGTFLRGVLDDFVRARVEAGEPLRLDYREGQFTRDRLVEIAEILKGLREEYRRPLSEHIDELLKVAFDEDFLRGCGQILSEDADGRLTVAPLIEQGNAVLDRARLLESFRSGKAARPLLLVGESGVGKSTAISLLARELRSEGYTIFKAGAADLLAGQVYMGELEQRIKHFVSEISGKRLVWIVENFHELAVAGTHRHSQTSILHLLFPHLESGAIRMIGEARPASLQKVVLTFPRLAAMLDIVRLEPPDDEATLELAREWVIRYPEVSNLRPRITNESLLEALELVKQYLREKEAPGNLIEFLKLTWNRILSRNSTSPPEESTQMEMATDDFIVAMSQLTSLPLDVIDERRTFDLDALAEEFSGRVLGQPEAVEVLVQRSAMIKAGTTDPTRPLGVFLFAGPTGTGKTQIAKTFTEFLFGSERRMIRLDMSEFQGPGSKQRLLGSAASGNGESTALVDQIRRQPFSLVLLDEFEKADPEIWDFFLQIFDDGRLTDFEGNTADFRNAVIILTSNIGSADAQAAALGFGNTESGYREEEILKSIDRTFRREFINRLDRVVVFRPLTRKTMREILKLELDDVLTRRGLRSRPWTVEWDDSTLDFLLEKGFSSRLGARPLRRAVERYVLTPLSVAIVKGEMPEGEQLLWVHARNGEVQGECVDLEVGPGDDSTDVADVAVDQPKLDTRQLILGCRGTQDELAHLRREYDVLVGLFELEEIVDQKRKALAALSGAGFWDSPERFRTLSYVEHIDRVEASLRSTGKLISRLESVSTSPGRGAVRLSKDILRRIAQRLYLFETAYPEIVEDRPRDAFLEVAASASGSGTNEIGEFGRRLGKMYLNWAEKRSMQSRVLNETDATEGGVAYRLLVAMEGFAAYTILSKEQGLHLLEESTTSETTVPKKSVVKVRVVAQPDEPPGYRNLTWREQAEATLRDSGAQELSLVRRYQERPTPLVRDRVRGWRTGRLDLVLDGNFDIIANQAK